MIDHKHTPQAAIVDYGLGNLYSIKNACAVAGMNGVITASKDDLFRADVVILPGIGAFEDAINNLHRLDLVFPLQEIAASDKMLVGICLGLQLMMTESYEFGIHKGLGLIEGSVVRFENPVGRLGMTDERILKVPQIGWNGICRPSSMLTGCDPWNNTPLEGLPDGEFMYFVHSYYARPADASVVLSTSKYGNIEFCSSVRRGNIFACQFHPERSGPHGLQIYKNIAAMCKQSRKEKLADV